MHSAQGRTAPGVIAVLDAGAMADSDLFYVEISRASEGFTLLTDDREALIEALETSCPPYPTAPSKPWARTSMPRSWDARRGGCPPERLAGNRGRGPANRTPRLHRCRATIA